MAHEDDDNSRPPEKLQEAAVHHFARHKVLRDREDKETILRD